MSDCDLWVSGTVFKCDGGHQARFGLIANNTIMNGGACHWFDQAKQVIFENNTCTGNNPMTMGNVRLLLRDLARDFARDRDRLLLSSLRARRILIVTEADTSSTFTCTPTRSPVSGGTIGR